MLRSVTTVVLAGALCFGSAATAMAASNPSGTGPPNQSCQSFEGPGPGVQAGPQPRKMPSNHEAPGNPDLLPPARNRPDPAGEAARRCPGRWAAMPRSTARAARPATASWNSPITDRTAVVKTLTADGNLQYYNVSGCDGPFRNGKPVTLSVIFTGGPKKRSPASDADTRAVPAAGQFLPGPRRAYLPQAVTIT